MHQLLPLMLAQAETTGETAEQVADTNLEYYLITYGIPAIKVILLLIVAYLVAKLLERMVRRTAEKARLEATLSRFFGKLTKWLIMIFAFVAALSLFGFEMTSVAAVLGASALAIGLAFQGTLSNFAAGIMLLVFRPFKVGDAINVSGETGKVYEIDLFNTMLDTFDNQRIILPNSSVFGSTITNITHHPYRRADVSVGVAYDADIDQTRSVLEKAAAAVDGRRDDPAPAVVLLGLGDSSVNWVVRVWADGDVFWDVMQATLRSVKQHLDEADIGIPFPQMDVHLDGELSKDAEAG